MDRFEWEVDTECSGLAHSVYSKDCFADSTHFGSNPPNRAAVQVQIWWYLASDSNSLLALIAYHYITLLHHLSGFI